MDTRFAAHNRHLTDPDDFRRADPHLGQLAGQPLVHVPELLERLPGEVPGIFTLGGGRQVGKTTLLKQWMARLLAQGTRPDSIAYLTGELIDDHHSLVRLISELPPAPSPGLRYVVVDEITYVGGWDKGIKFLADAGELQDSVLVLTGSDLAFIQEARMRFPGRRGTAPTVDFHLHPLSFREAVLLERPELGELVARGRVGEVDATSLTGLFDAFGGYLAHGGFLTAMNDMARDGRISAATFATYSDWIRGDVLKRGKQETYLREVLSAITRRRGAQVSWARLASDLSIDQPRTVADYVGLLEAMDVALVQPALVEHRLAAAPKKARKVSFRDPFIHHAVQSWLEPVADPFAAHVEAALADPDRCAWLAESCAAAHARRLWPTYYIKGEGEVDVAWVADGRFWPVEIKWSRQLNPKDLKQVAKYPNARIWSRARAASEVRGVPVEPLPLALFRLGA